MAGRNWGGRRLSRTLSYNWVAKFIQTDLTHHVLFNSLGDQGQVHWLTFLSFWLFYLLEDDNKFWYMYIMDLWYLCSIYKGPIIYSIMKCFCINDIRFRIWSFLGTMLLSSSFMRALLSSCFKFWLHPSCNRVFVYEGFLSNEECDHLISLVCPCFCAFSISFDFMPTIFNGFKVCLFGLGTWL